MLRLGATFPQKPCLLENLNMKRTILPILFFALCSFGSWAQSLSKEDFVQDLEFLKKTLPEKHTNLFAKIDRAQFENKVDQILMRSNSLDWDRFIAELFKLTVSIGDEHTFIEVDFTKTLPIQFEVFKEGLFVTGIDSAHSSLLNSKLESINGHPVSEVVTRFKEIILHENPSYFNDHLVHHLNNPVLLKGLGLIDDVSKAIFVFSTNKEQTTKISLASVAGNNAAKLPLVRSGQSLLSKKKAGNYWFEYSADKKILYFNYSQCREMPNYPFAKFNDELFASINEHKPEKIVLDLRYNSGGNSGILEPFTEQIKQSYLNQKNKFFVLIGKTTFSSAVMNAVDLKRNLNITLIGQPSAGLINGYGEVRGFALPKSKTVVAYSTRYWERWKGKKGPLKPDVAVDYSIKNYIAGQDEALMQVEKR